MGLRKYINGHFFDTRGSHLTTKTAATMGRKSKEEESEEEEETEEEEDEVDLKWVGRSVLG